MLVVAARQTPLFHHGSIGRVAEAVQIQTAGLVLDIVIPGIRGHQLPVQVGAGHFGPLPHRRAGTGGTAAIVNDQPRGAVLDAIPAVGGGGRGRGSGDGAGHVGEVIPRIGFSRDYNASGRAQAGKTVAAGRVAVDLLKRASQSENQRILAASAAVYCVVNGRQAIDINRVDTATQVEPPMHVSRINDCGVAAPAQTNGSRVAGDRARVGEIAIAALAGAVGVVIYPNGIAGVGNDRARIGKSDRADGAVIFDFDAPRSGTGFGDRPAVVEGAVAIVSAEVNRVKIPF